jgi:transcriptional regulator with XRE-family HTH domain
MKAELYEHTNAELIRELGKRYRDYRMRYGKSQRDVAAETGLSVFTISGFERGQNTGITLANLLKLLRAIEGLEQFDSLLQELPASPSLMYKQQNRKK